jgi:hypothetical protein
MEMIDDALHSQPQHVGVSSSSPAFLSPRPPCADAGALANIPCHPTKLSAPPTS